MSELSVWAIILAGICYVWILIYAVLIARLSNKIDRLENKQDE